MKTKKTETTLAAHIARVTKANKAFEKASPAKKRVIIAKDVIAMVSERAIKPKTQGYFVLGCVTDDICTTTDLREVMTKVPSCTVCGIGALLAATVAREDKFNLTHTTDLYWGVRLTYSSFRHYLTDFFSHEQLRLVEAAFERTTCLGNTSFSEVDGRRAVRFGRKYALPRTRMLAIMRNIVANGGEFVPPPFKGDDDEMPETTDGP